MLQSGGKILDQQSANTKRTEKAAGCRARLRRAPCSVLGRKGKATLFFVRLCRVIRWWLLFKRYAQPYGFHLLIHDHRYFLLLKSIILLSISIMLNPGCNQPGGVQSHGSIIHLRFIKQTHLLCIY